MPDGPASAGPQVPPAPPTPAGPPTGGPLAFRARLLRRRWLLLGAALVLVGAGWLVSDVLRIKRDLETGREELTNLDLVTVDADGGLDVVVDRAADRLDAADALARSSIPLRALSLIPGLSGQIDAVRDLTGTVADVGAAAREAADAIQTGLDEGSGAAARLQITRIAAAELDHLREVVAGVRLTDRWLVPPLDAARDDLLDSLDDAEGDLAHGVQLVGALQRFLVGPRRYLILGGNNAEMRSGGIPTTSGIATIEDGAITTGDFRGASGGVELDEPGVAVPPEYETVYGFLEGNRGYRTATSTANWPLAAQIMSEITDVNVYGHVDGIIFIDTIALSVLLDVVGPVVVDGREYRSDNVIEELLYRNYLEFPTFDESGGRRELQSDVANAVFDALNERDFSVTRLVGFLSELAANRSLLAWSSDPAENDLWVTFGADGALHPNTIGVISDQLNASKLDYFAHLEVDLDSHVEGSRHHVRMTVRVVNPEHPETSPYIDGGGYYADPGEVGSYLVFYLPAGADDIVNSDPGISHFARDGDTYAVGIVTRVPEGDQREVTLDFTLPLRPDDTLEVLPSARILPTRWTVGGEVGFENQGLSIHLDESGATLDNEGRSTAGDIGATP